MVREVRHLSATLILDSEDAYARTRGTRGLHPRPVGLVTYDLAGRVVAGQREMFDEPASLVIRHNASGYGLFFGEVRPRNGTHRRADEGRYVLRVGSPAAYYQSSEREVLLPNPETPVFIDLQPGYAYPFPTETVPGGRGPTLLRGTYLQPDGQGVAGTTVHVPGRTGPYTTDPSGQWVLVFPDDEPTGAVTVRFQTADGTVEMVSNVAVVGGRETSLGQTALRGWTLTSAGTPMVGATVGVSGRPETVQSPFDGRWSFYFPLSQPAGAVTVTATLPDGRQQARPNVQVQPRSTVAVPAFLF